MARLIITSIAVYLLTAPTVLACDCEYQGSFMKMTQRTPLVAVVKVIKYLTFKEIYYVKTPMSMEVEIVEIYKGKEDRKTVIVWGDIGYLCRPYLSEFKEGQYYAIAFDKGNFHGRHPDEKDTDYSISICGAYWVTVDFGKSNVTGDIDSGNRTISTIRLPDLRSRLMNAEQSNKVSGLQIQNTDSSIAFKPCLTPISYAVDDMLLKEQVGQSLSKPSTNPIFKGGVDELKKYFSSNPLTDTKAKGIVFRVHIGFVVNCSGQYGNLQIISKGKGDFEMLAQQVLANAEKMPQYWQSATVDNKTVDSYQILSFTVVGGALDKVSYR